MSMPEPVLNPKDTTNFLLGGISAKVDTVLANQTTYDDRLRTVEGQVQGILTALPKKTPWYSVAAGIGSIAAVALSAIAILKVLNP